MLHGFQHTQPGTHTFNLRLIELIAVACHQIGAYLFELDNGVHKHQLHQDWAARVRRTAREERRRLPYYVPPCAFFHCAFTDHARYPRGMADVAGYWAEGKIFGGVVLFDRGETDDEVSRA